MAEQLVMNINVDELARSGAIINKIRTYYNSKIVGQSQLGVSLLVSMIANGHVLLESVPGLAKTTAAKVMTEAVGGSFSRVQCTPDLLPSDIIGTQTFNMTNNTFETKIGLSMRTSFSWTRSTVHPRRHSLRCSKRCRRDR